MESPGMEQQYRELKILNTIAIQLNKTIELNKALKVVLNHTVELMNLNTGWIWLLHPASNSVFLAASHHLPPAFTKHPERLSGWCYCIDKYLKDKMEGAANISEISCSRLKDLDEGTGGLRYHACIPLFDGEQKIGLLNIVSENTGQFSERQLDLLYTIGELLSVSISRARQFEQSRETGIREERSRIARFAFKEFHRQIKELQAQLERYRQSEDSKSDATKLEILSQSIEDLLTLAKQSTQDLKEGGTTTYQESPFQYPSTPLTKREIEVLELLKKGKTNKAIGVELFISERTVKFHVSTLLSKLHAQNRTEVVRVAIKRGYISID